MKVDKGDVLTFLFRVDDPAAAGALFGGFLDAHLARKPVSGVLVLASALGDVFAERDALEEDADDDDEWDADDDDDEGDAPPTTFSEAVRNARQAFRGEIPHEERPS